MPSLGRKGPESRPWQTGKVSVPSIVVLFQHEGRCRNTYICGETQHIARGDIALNGAPYECDAHSVQVAGPTEPRISGIA